MLSSAYLIKVRYKGKRQQVKPTVWECLRENVPASPTFHATSKGTEASGALVCQLIQ